MLSQKKFGSNSLEKSIWIIQFTWKFKLFHSKLISIWKPDLPWNSWLLCNKHIVPYAFFINLFFWRVKEVIWKVLSNNMYVSVLGMNSIFKPHRSCGIFTYYSVWKTPSAKQMQLGERQTSQQAGEGMGAACEGEARTDQHCRHCFPGCQKSPFCLQLVPEGNMQQQKGGSSLTLSSLNVQKQISMWCLRL